MNHKAGIRPSGLTALRPAPPPLRTGAFWKDGSKRLPTLRRGFRELYAFLTDSPAARAVSMRICRSGPELSTR